MNKLRTGDYYITSSFDDRLSLLNHLERYGIPIENDTWRERELIADFHTYPSLVYSENHGVIAVKTDDNRLSREFSREDFIIKSGTPLKVWSGNKLKFNFF